MNEHEDNDILSPRAQSRMLKEIHRALVGNPMRPHEEPGMLKKQADMDADLYGPNGNDGIKAKVESLWDGRTKLIFACTVCTGIIGFLSWLIPVLLKVSH